MHDDLSPKLFSLEWALQTSEKIEDIFIVRVIRNGLVTMIPVLLIGAFALVFQSFPVQAYQHFIKSFAGGFLYSFFHIIYGATFGVLSLYMVGCFSVSFFAIKTPDKTINMWGVISALVSFMIMIGIWSDSFAVFDLGATSVFLAIVTTLASSELFYVLSQRYNTDKIVSAYGPNTRFGTVMGVMVPFAVTISAVALVAFLVTLTGNATMHALIANSLYAAFKMIQNTFIQGLCFVFMVHFLWIFGIHGSDCLQLVAEQIYRPMIDINSLAFLSGVEPPNILCVQFFNAFILMGGCGSCICLFLAIMFFSRNRGMKLLAKSASIPMLFNINELVVFGLPIVFNPIICIPFILVPIIQYLVAYSAISLGLVPHLTFPIEWTTPVLIGGYIATGSLQGSVLQVVNIAIGTAIYTPFVKLLGNTKDNREGYSRKKFVNWYIANESKNPNLQLVNLHGIYGDIARRMALELKWAMRQEKFELYYQPQYRYNGECMGVEALLRWPKVEWLSVYPPLVIKLAQEQGMLLQLEKSILKRAMDERELVFQQFGRGIKISVNVTGRNAAEPAYWAYVKELWHTAPFTEGTLCIEVTEQDAIIFDEKIMAEFRSCKELGIKFAIDDFSSGQTSMDYLKNGLFNMLKIDGSLVKIINENPRCRDIIASLVSLSASLHIDCLAEYVANERIRDTLHEVGCDLYQGYFYSPPVPLEGKKSTKEHSVV